MSKRVNWQSVNNIQYVLTIDDGTSGVTDLQPADSPFVTQTDTDEDFFCPVRAQTGNIGIKGVVSDMESLLASAPIQRPVEMVAYIHGTSVGTVWKGFLQTGTWSQPWDSGPLDVSLPVVSYLGILGSFSPTLTGYVTFGDFLSDMISAPTGSYFYSSVLVPKVSDPLHTMAYMFSMENYRTWNTELQQYVVDSYLDILTDICTMFGWQAQERGDQLVLLAADQSAYGYYEVAPSALASMSGATSVSVTTDTETVYAADHTISYLPGRKDVEVKGDVNPIDKTIWQLNLNELGQSGAQYDVRNIENQMVYYFTRNFYNGEEVTCLSPQSNIRYDGFHAGTDGDSVVYSAELRTGGYWDNGAETVADAGWMHSSRLVSVTAGQKITLQKWLGYDTDTVPVIIVYNDQGAILEQVLYSALVVNGTPVQYEFQSTGTMGLNYHFPLMVTDAAYQLDSGVGGQVTGSCVVSDRMYSYKQGGGLRKPEMSTGGWMDHFIVCGSLAMGESALVTITPRTQFYHSALTDGKIFRLTGNVKRAAGTLDEWEDFDGYLYIRIKVGTHTIYEQNAPVIEGKLDASGLDMSADPAGGIGVECPSYDGQITVELCQPDPYTDIWETSDYNYYYSISDVKLEYDWSWQYYLWEVEDTNVSRRDIGGGFTESCSVELKLTTQQGGQFGHGLILDGNRREVTVLYGGETPEEALADRLEAYYSEAREKLEVTVRCEGQMLKPWNLHDVGGSGYYHCLAQSIDWAEDEIKATLYKNL